MIIMRKSWVLELCVLTVSSLTAQQNTTYGLVRKNYYSTISDPIDTSFYYEQFDSCTIRLGSINPSTGEVINLGTSFRQFINLTGAALNPYTNTYIFIGAQMHSMDLTSGEIVTSVELTNPIQESYFDNFRFNNADSTLYGLARRNTYDPITQTNFGEVYLAKADPTTGIITQISPNSVGQGFALAGSAIDPHQMVFYYSTGSNLMGLDLYSGEIYSNPTISIPDGIAFDNFAYSCADTAIYGLIRQNYFSYIFDPNFPNDSISVLDSATVRLGKINPTTGLVTSISPASVSLSFGYSLNGGATIDPNEMIYYYSTGAGLIGVSLNTGLPVSNVPYSGQDGQYFDLIRNYDDCKFAQAVRPNEALSLDEGTQEANLELFPNPANEQFTIRSVEPIKSIQVIDNSGRTVKTISFDDLTEVSISVSDLNAGMYMLLINETKQMKLVVEHE